MNKTMKFNFSLPKASNERNEFNLSHSHILTHNFGVQNIVSAIDVKRGDDIVIDLSAFTRLMPLPCPTYGGVKITHRAYAVNYEFVLRHFEEFLTYNKIPYSSGARALGGFNMPWFYASDLLDCLCGEGGSSTEFVDVVTSSVEYDLVFYASGQTPIYYKYTTKGRKIVSWLSQLGYKLPAVYGNTYANVRYDCLALFAFWKYYLDWVVPARFVYSVPEFINIKGLIENLNCQDDSIHFVADFNAHAATEFILNVFLQVPTSFLDDDIYTTAFTTPYGPESSISEDITTITGLDPVSTSAAGMQATANPVVPSGANGVAGIYGITSTNKLNEISLLSLGQLQRLVNKKKITSTDVLDYLRVTYGITPSADSLRLSRYLGAHESQIMIGDVMANATTQLEGQSPTYVGQYAGKGIGGSSAKWRFKSDFVGIIFVTCEISTKSSYVNGISPLRQRFKASDFYDPHFDNVGVRAISQRELVYNTFEKVSLADAQNMPSPDHIFGFSPRYSEYKYKNDEVSGDFMFPSVNKGLDSWYLNRKFKHSDAPVIGIEFLSATSDSVGSQYDRIFQNTNNIDHFYSVYKVDIHATSLMERIFDYFKTLSEDENKPDVDVEIN